MAKSNIKNLQATLDRVKDALTQISDETYKDIGNYVRDRIVAKARTGKTMVSGEEGPIKPLSSGYIEQRKRWKKSGKHDIDGDFFSPPRSNLTLTGQFLKSIIVKSVDRAKRIITIQASGTRTDGLENRKLAEYLSQQGRNIFGIDKAGRQAIKQKVLRALRTQIKQKLLRK